MGMSSASALAVALPLLPRRQLTLTQTQAVVSLAARHWWTQAVLHCAMRKYQAARPQCPLFKVARRCECLRELGVKATGLEMPFIIVSVVVLHWKPQKSRISRAIIGQPINSPICSTAAPPCSGSKYILNFGAMGSMAQLIGCRTQPRRQRLSVPQHLTKPNATTAIFQAVGRLRPFDL